ncbi:hypothetical protein RRG08_043130 [Elysia crispata]|uniref:Uncharacterized protein n=1 Tax=Elysia crispata TaxID=231223 RepID=A0AAE0YN27_9GAST|nr:hypothetical protein RRG08_043130 [Elysia crispata]
MRRLVGQSDWEVGRQIKDSDTHKECQPSPRLTVAANVTPCIDQFGESMAGSGLGQGLGVIPLGLGSAGPGSVDWMDLSE